MRVGGGSFLDRPGGGPWGGVPGPGREPRRLAGRISRYGFFQGHHQLQRNPFRRGAPGHHSAHRRTRVLAGGRNQEYRQAGAGSQYRHQGGFPVQNTDMLEV